MYAVVNVHCCFAAACLFPPVICFVSRSRSASLRPVRARYGGRSRASGLEDRYAANYTNHAYFRNKKGLPCCFRVSPLLLLSFLCRYTSTRITILTYPFYVVSHYLQYHVLSRSGAYLRTWHTKADTMLYPQLTMLCCSYALLRSAM